MFHDYENHIRIAIDRIGGPTKVSTMLGVATGTIHSWIRGRRISNIDYARAVSEASHVELQKLRWTK